MWYQNTIQHKLVWFMSELSASKSKRRRKDMRIQTNTKHKLLTITFLFSSFSVQSKDCGKLLDKQDVVEKVQVVSETMSELTTLDSIISHLKEEIKMVSGSASASIYEGIHEGDASYNESFSDYVSKLERKSELTTRFKETLKSLEIKRQITPEKAFETFQDCMNGYGIRYGVTQSDKSQSLTIDFRYNTPSPKKDQAILDLTVANGFINTSPQDAEKKGDKRSVLKAPRNRAVQHLKGNTKNKKGNANHYSVYVHADTTFPITVHPLKDNGVTTTRNSEKIPDEVSIDVTSAWSMSSPLSGSIKWRPNPLAFAEGRSSHYLLRITGIKHHAKNCKGTLPSGNYKDAKVGWLLSEISWKENGEKSSPLIIRASHNEEYLYNLNDNRGYNWHNENPIPGKKALNTWWGGVPITLKQLLG
jgi:hypothetical protein